MPKSKKKPKQPERKWLLLTIIFLLLVGCASSIYLSYLFLEVHQSNGAQVHSFCQISEKFNCVTVATSKYSIFLGIPVAFLGVEFFLIALILVGLAVKKVWGLSHWQSLLFDAMLCTLPACGALAYISVKYISSVCIMCLTVYFVNLVIFLLLAGTHRGRIGKLIKEGPQELLRVLSSKNVGVLFTLSLLLFVSQPFWFPKILPNTADAAENHHSWEGLPTKGQTLGPADAPIQIAEYTDFQCPFCGKAHQVMMRLIQQFPQKIHLIHRDFPLDQACNPMIKHPFHPHACQAAYYARCAAEQDKYWPFENLLFQNRESLGKEYLEAFSEKVGLNMTLLTACVKNPRTHEAVLKDIKAGLNLKIDGTPAFMVNGEMIVGLNPIEFWVQKIETLLKKQR